MRLVVRLGVGGRERGVPLFREMGGRRIADDEKDGAKMKKHRDNDSVNASMVSVNWLIRETLCSHDTNHAKKSSVQIVV